MIFGEFFLLFLIIIESLIIPLILNLRGNMDNAYLLSDVDGMDSDVRIDVRCGRYPPQKSIWHRQGLLNGRSVELLNEQTKRLKGKIKRESAFIDNLAVVSQVVFWPSGFVGFLSFVGGTGLTFSSCFDSEQESNPTCTVGVSMFAASSLLLSIPLSYYARHRYKLANGKCPLWKEKVRVLDIFRERLQGRPYRGVLSVTVLRDLLIESNLPRSLKEQVAVGASLDQHFEAAKDLSKEDVKNKLYPLMHPDDQAALHFLLYPLKQEEIDLIRGLRQFRQFFVEHPSILSHMIDQIPTFFEQDIGKELLQTIVDLREQQNVPVDDCARKIERLLSDSVTIRIGGEKVKISRRKLCQYDRFAIYFPEKKQDSPSDGDDNGAACATGTVHGGVWNIAAVAEGDSGEEIFDFPLLPDQNEALLVLILQFIQTGQLPDEIENPIALIKEADYYGVKPLVDACIKCLLDAIASGEVRLTKEEKADQFEGIIQMFPEGSFPESVKQAVANEYSSAADGWGKIQEVRFWLEFAERVSPDQLFHQLDNIPRCFSTEFFDLIYQMKPKGIYRKLLEKLQKNCIGSHDPASFLKTYENNTEICAFLADSTLNLTDKRHIVPVWEFASRKENFELKGKVVQRLKLDPTLAAQWPFLSFPEELERMVRGS